MGYTTDFTGSLSLSRVLTDVEKNYINTFSRTRRMKRDVNKLMELYKGKYGYPQTQSNLLPTSENKGVGDLVLNTETNTFEEQNISEAEKFYGKDGEFFVKDDGDFGQGKDSSIIDYNTPPGQLGYEDKSMAWDKRYKENQKRTKEGKAQPSLWCQWVINERNELVWDGGEKFYSYVEWLQYLITNFFQPWGVLLNGEIEWVGEESSDLGKIIVNNNIITVKTGRVVYN
jgi:hypothetical protein